MAYAGTAADGEHLKRHLHVKFCCSAKHIFRRPRRVDVYVYPMDYQDNPQRHVLHHIKWSRR